MFEMPGVQTVLRHAAQVALVVGLSMGTAVAAPQLQLNMTAPQYFDTDSIGTNGEGQLGFGFQLLTQETAEPPFTLRAHLPAHVTYRSFNGAGWSCSAAASVVTCVYSAQLNMWNWQSSGLGINIDVDGNLPVPGSSAMRMTLESAQVPLTNPLVCEDVPSFNVATSDTGCVERSVPHRLSRLVFVPGGWTHHAPVFEAGSTGQFQTAWESIGFGLSNGTVTSRFLLPPGITYASLGGITQWTCNAATPDAQGQLVTCTTPG